MVAVILGCSSLAGHVEAAQAKMQTNYPFIALERKYPVNPKQMRVEILQALQQLPAEVDTVLVAMGFCGGSWQNVAARQRLVLPCVDDCITLLLHTDGERHFNLKQKNHFYLRDTDEGEYSLEGIYQGLCQKNGSAKGAEIFNSWFAPFTDADIIDTGVMPGIIWRRPDAMPIWQNAGLIMLWAAICFWKNWFPGNGISSLLLWSRRHMRLRPTCLRTNKDE